MKAISHSLFLFVVLFQPLRSGYAVQTPTPIEFRNYEVVNGFPQSLTFEVDICNAPEKSTVYLYYTIGQSSWTLSDNKVFSEDSTEAGCQHRRTSIATRDEPPMVDIQYYWLVRLKGEQVQSPRQECLYEDPRFEWQVLRNKEVVVQWHDQPAEFGKKVFDIATRSIEQQRELYGADLQSPAQIIIENTDEEFMSWQLNPDPDTGGLALPWYGMTIQLVDEFSEEWLNDVLPHEISHLYFYQVTKAGDAWPPLWLDEGLAVYNEFSDHNFEDEIVQNAVLEDRLIPLLLLREGFGAEDHQVDLAYAESYYAVLYILEVHGNERLGKLLDAYNRDKEPAEAFRLAFNQPLDEFEQDWEEWVKTKLEAGIPATTTPSVQGQTPAPYPVRPSLVLILLVCCFSLVGITGLGLVIYLVMDSTMKKTDS